MPRYTAHDIAIHLLIFKGHSGRDRDAEQAGQGQISFSFQFTTHHGNGYSGVFCGVVANICGFFFLLSGGEVALKQTARNRQDSEPKHWLSSIVANKRVVGSQDLYLWRSYLYGPDCPGLVEALTHAINSNVLG